MDTINALILLAAIIIVFLVCREIVCWYWKLNRIVSLQEDQGNTLKAILNVLNKNAEANVQSTILETGDGTTGKLVSPK